MQVLSQNNALGDGLSSSVSPAATCPCTGPHSSQEIPSPLPRPPGGYFLCRGEVPALDSGCPSTLTAHPVTLLSALIIQDQLRSISGSFQTAPVILEADLFLWPQSSRKYQRKLNFHQGKDCMKLFPVACWYLVMLNWR